MSWFQCSFETELKVLCHFSLSLSLRDLTLHRNWTQLFPQALSGRRHNHRIQGFRGFLAFRCCNLGGVERQPRDTLASLGNRKVKHRLSAVLGCKAYRHMVGPSADLCPIGYSETEPGMFLSWPGDHATSFLSKDNCAYCLPIVTVIWSAVSSIVKQWAAVKIKYSETRVPLQLSNPIPPVRCDRKRKITTSKSQKHPT